MAQLPITRQRWTPPAARVEGDRLLKARAAQQRMIDAAIQAKAEAKAVEVQAEKQLAEKVDELDKDLDRLIDNIPKIMPSGGGGRRMVKKILANEYDLPNGLGSAAGNDTEDFATAAQGGKADTAVQPDTSFSATVFDSDALRTATSTTGGYWTTGDNKTATKSTVFITDQVDSLETSASLRDGHFNQVVDQDDTDYSAVPHRVITNGFRSFVTGRDTGSGYEMQYKDLHGLWGAAVGKTGGTFGTGTRGVSGVLGGAIQFGTGVATNEFLAQNVEGGDHSSQLCAVYGIVRSGVGDEDTNHLAFGFSANIGGYRATAAFRAAAITYAAILGTAKYGVKMDEIAVSTAAIQMPNSVSGNAGTTIVYDTDDNTYFNRSANTYNWVIGGEVIMSVGGVWATMSPPPTVVASSGTITSASAILRYAVMGKTVHVSGTITVTTNGTGAGRIDLSLPFASASAAILNGATRGTRNKACYASILGGGATTARIFLYDGTYPATDGEVIDVSGAYQRV